MYEPFGDVSFSSGTRDKFLYNAKEADLTGLYYYGARYYDPKFQRFTQADTKLPNIHDPQQLNRYSYVRNSPYKYVDVTGHYICDFDSECATINILGQNVYFGNLEWEEGDEALEDGKITFIHESKIESRNQWKLALWMVAADSAVNVPNTFSSGSIKQSKPKIGNNQNQLDTEIKNNNDNSKVPNPYGKKGGPEHQAKINELEQNIENRGLVAQREYPIPDSKGRIVRYVDIAALDTETKSTVMELHQVGKTTKSGLPVSRERSAMSDIYFNTGKEVCYHDYTK